MCVCVCVRVCPPILTNFPGSHGPQTWWVSVAWSQPEPVYVGLVTRGQGQVKFQRAPIEPKLGSSVPEDGAS